MKTKRLSYEQIIARLDSALEQEYYLEASWIAYSLLEDRTESALEKTGGVLSNPRASIEAKLKELEKRSASNTGLRSVSEFPDIFDEVRKWKDKRNPLMHRMVEMPKSWEDINVDARDLAKESRELLGRYSSAVMKLRKWYMKRGPGSGK